jgi:hypothetical protein
MADGVVDRQLPDDPPVAGGVFDGRQPDLLLAQPEVDLPAAATGEPWSQRLLVEGMVK